MEHEAERIRTAIGDLIAHLDVKGQDAVLRRVVELVRASARAEREHCTQLCRHRADVWSGTLAATSAVPQARDEARARANEARYLADLIETGHDLYPDADA